MDSCLMTCPQKGPAKGQGRVLLSGPTGAAVKHAVNKVGPWCTDAPCRLIGRPLLESHALLGGALQNTSLSTRGLSHFWWLSSLPFTSVIAPVKWDASWGLEEVGTKSESRYSEYKQSHVAMCVCVQILTSMHTSAVL